MNRSCVAEHVRVVLNKTFKERSMNDGLLKEEPYLIIGKGGEISNDKGGGDYIYVHGASFVTSGFVYLSEVDLDVQVPLHVHNKEIRFVIEGDVNSLLSSNEFKDQYGKLIEEDDMEFGVEIIIRRREFKGLKHLM